MSIDSPSGRARALWQEQAAAPDAAFGTPGRPAVLVSPASSLAPPSWVGVVTIGDTALITAPTTRAAESVTTALAGLPTDRLTDPATVTGLLPVADTLGPAVLAYLAPDALRPPRATGTPTGRLTPGSRGAAGAVGGGGRGGRGRERAGGDHLTGLRRTGRRRGSPRCRRLRPLAARHRPPLCADRTGGTGPGAGPAGGLGGHRTRPRRRPAPAVAGPSGRLPPGGGGTGLPGAGRPAERTTGLNAVRRSTPGRSGPARAHNPTISWMQTILTRMARANSVEYPLLIRLSLARLLAYATIAGLPT